MVLISTLLRHFCWVPTTCLIYKEKYQYFLVEKKKSTLSGFIGLKLHFLLTFAWISLLSIAEDILIFRRKSLALLLAPLAKNKCKDISTYKAFSEQKLEQLNRQKRINSIKYGKCPKISYTNVWQNSIYKQCSPESIYSLMLLKEQSDLGLHCLPFHSLF